jgi:hypothetical protein
MKKVTKNKVLVLRTCNEDMTAHGGFKWPKKGPVAAPDWNPSPVCGGGLHGLLWGMGDSGLLNWGEKAKWMAVEVDASKIVDLQGKVKFPKGRVVLVGSQVDVCNYIAERAPVGSKCIGSCVKSGDRGTATAGYMGTATAGDMGTATAGDRGTATAGDAGFIAITWFDSSKSKYRRAIAAVGENGIEPKVKYKLDEKGNFIKA